MSKTAIIDPRVAEADDVLLGAPDRMPDPEAACDRYEALAKTDNAVAATRLSVLIAGGLGRPQSWDGALDWMMRAAEAGHDLAQRQLLLLAKADATSDWRRLRENIDIPAYLATSGIDRLTDKASVGAARGFAQPAFCTWLIERARGRLERAYINDPASGEQREHPMRTATTCAFGPLDRDLIVAIMQERAARISNVPVAQHEAPNVISYEPGQKFDRHYDFFEPQAPGYEQEVLTQGQRVITVVTYLNDDFDGAPTQFPLLGLEFKGETGDAVAFSNVLGDGAPDRNTLHAGLPPTQGRKWVLSQWIRSLRQVIR